MCKKAILKIHSLVIFIKRRMKYIDEDLQNKRRNANRTADKDRQTGNENKKPGSLITTPFTMSEIQNIELQNSPLANKLKNFDDNMSSRSKVTSFFGISKQRSFILDILLFNFDFLEDNNSLSCMVEGL
jgi:hypothetical protein